MTPNEMLEHVRATVPGASIWNTGGNCGAIGVSVNGYDILVTTDSGPWATPTDDDVDRGNNEWFVCMWPSEGDGGTWVDGTEVRDGDTLIPAGSVPVVVHRLANSVSV